MIQYKFFMQRNSVWAYQHLTHTNPIEELKDFPGESVIHLLDSLNDTIPSYVPKNNPFLFLGKNKKYIRHVVNLKKQDTDILELPDKGIYLPPVQWQRPVNDFTHTTNQLIRVIPMGAADPIITNTTEYFINYNFLFRATTRSSILPTLRKFDYIFSGVINKMMEHQTLNHFVLIPMPTDISVIFKRSDFDRTFTKIDRSTLRYPDFVHYLFFVYLLNFVHNESELGPLNAIPHEMWKHTNFIVYNDSQYVIYNLGALKDLNVGNKISTEDEEKFDSHKDHLGTNRIVYRLIEQFNRLSRVVTDETTVSKVIDPKLVTVNHNVHDLNVPSVRNVISSHVESKEITEQKHKELTQGIEKHIDDAAIEHIENNPNLSERQKTKALSLAIAYKDITLGGEKATDILHAHDHSIDEINVEVLDKFLVDKSMKKSKIIYFDISYMTKTFKQDLLGALAFFNRLGMFLIDIKEEDTSDELNQSMLYTVKWTDSTNTPHPPMRFSIPKVDADGRCYLNGVYRIMKKQRVNNPICKVSPSRIALTSAYNKAIVEKATTSNTQFYPFFTSLLLPGKPEIDLGNADVSSSIKLPYEYGIISRKILKFVLRNNTFVFDYNNRYDSIDPANHKIVKTLERYGVYCGFQNNSNIYFFMDYKGRFLEIDISTLKSTGITTICNKIAHLNEISSNGKLNEFVQLKILSRNMPLGFVLCYKYGLSHMLKYLHVNYKVFTKRDPVISKIDDVIIEFKDCTLVIPRAPILQSSIIGGLAFFNTKKYNIEQMDDQDVYFDIMAYKGYGNYLKGVDSFFDLFIGFIEYKVLKQMGEPVNLKDLLIRAAVMLTTTEHKGASSSTQFRIRSYEKYVHVIYNELARAYATWKHKSIGHSSKFSINPYVIQQRINEDASFDKLDVINPMHQIKMKSAFSHLGEGGRTADTFMIADRKFDKDSIGILSSDTVDNSSVAVNGSLTMNPNILNTTGMTQTKNIDEATPTEILSAVSLVFPGITQDD